jgi:hypothetical protein
MAPTLLLLLNNCCDAPFNVQNTIEQDWRNLPFKEEYLSNREWHPGNFEDAYMSRESYEEQIKIFNDAEKMVVFKNTYISYDSCDCGDGYGCSHGSWPYEIKVFDESRKKCVNEIQYEDGDQIFIEGDLRQVTLNKIYSNLTLGEFYDFCKMVGVQLLLNKEQGVQESDTTGDASSNSVDKQEIKENHIVGLTEMVSDTDGSQKK